MRLSIGIKYGKNGIEKMTLFSIDEYGNTEQHGISISVGEVLIRSGVSHESM